MQPYRLEMGTRLATPVGQTLLPVLGARIAQHLNTCQQDEDAPIVLNLASQEYFKSVDRKQLRARVVECVRGLEERCLEDHQFHAKRARGFDGAPRHCPAHAHPASSKILVPRAMPTMLVHPALTGWCFAGGFELGYKAPWSPLQFLLQPAFPTPARKARAYGPHCIDLVSGHRVQRLLTINDPGTGQPARADRCAALIDAARLPICQSARPCNSTPGARSSTPTAPATACSSGGGETPLIQRIEERLATCWAGLENCEGLQVLRYGPGVPGCTYGFDPAELGTPTLLERGGQRVATLLIYLSTPDEGGADVPDLRLEAAPQRGHTVFFRYDQPHPASRTLRRRTLW